MRALIGILISLSLAAACAPRQDELFQSWEEARRDFKSLVVRFTLTTKDGITAATRSMAGSLRLIRTPTGELFGKYEIGSEAQRPHTDGRLHGGRVYLLDHLRRHAMPFDRSADDPLGFLEECLNPFVACIDRRRMEKKWNVEVTKHDDWYTYMSMRLKNPSNVGNFSEGRIAVMNRDSEGVPKNMPRRIELACPNGDISTFDILTWRLNSASAPKPEEFVRPEDMPQWQVHPLKLGHLFRVAGTHEPMSK